MQSLNINTLESIIRKTVGAVEAGQTQIYELTGQALLERQNMEMELNRTRQELADVIKQTDRLEIELRRSRLRLVELSHRFHTDERELKAVYDRTHQLQTELRLSEEKERQLRERRDELERRLKHMDQMIEKAQNLGTQMSIVHRYLTGDLSQMSKMVEQAQESQELGLKVIEAQEAERKRVAREIHDGPAQALANVLLQSEIIERTWLKGNTEQAQEELRSLKRNASETLSDLRRIIFDLRPMALDDLGLVPTLHKYVDKMKASHEIGIDLKIIGEEPALPSAMTVALFRLAQEAITNVLKHAQATYLEIRLEFASSAVNLVVRDNGKGFDPDEKKDGFGLLGMKERVKLLEGKIKFESRAGWGTRVMIHIPLQEKITVPQWSTEPVRMTKRRETL
jgi:two-component system sensor histidine kinase DegS